MTKAKAPTIESYLDNLSDSHKAALQKLRGAIQKLAPDAEEYFSYGIPAFRWNGKPLVAYSATPKHCAFFPMDSTSVAENKKALADFSTSKGTIRFQPEKPIPASLVRKIVKGRMEFIKANEKPKAAAKKRGSATRQISALPDQPSVEDRSKAVVAMLHKMASRKVRDGMARYGIPSDNALGIAVGAMQKYAKQLGKHHDLAQELWKTGIYEARMMATFLDEPAKVTPEQMDRWCHEFDSWAICDTVCFKLFDQTPFAIKKAKEWAKSKLEFVKRGGFALMACVALHDKTSEDPEFVPMISLIEKGANDDRNFVMKGMSWALRSIGERSPFLNGLAIESARKLADSANASSRWIGKDVLRQLDRAATRKRLDRKSK